LRTVSFHVSISSKLIGRSSESTKSYTLPDKVPQIPLRPAKPSQTREPSPDGDIVPLGEAPVASAAPSNKRSAPDEEDLPAITTKKQKVAVFEDDDDDFQIL
jgi:hypothetical protein